MQTAQRIINHYRRNHFIFCTIYTLATLVFTLNIRFISEQNLRLSSLIMPLMHWIMFCVPSKSDETFYYLLLEFPCATAQLPLHKQATRLKTIHSIGLVKEGILYCSSILGARNVPMRQLQPDLPATYDLLMLSTDQSLLKGTPILIQ